MLRRNIEDSSVDNMPTTSLKIEPSMLKCLNGDTVFMPHQQHALQEVAKLYAFQKYGSTSPKEKDFDDVDVSRLFVHDTGTGKTFTAILCLAFAFHQAEVQGKPRKAIVAVPRGVAKMWQNMLRKIFSGDVMVCFAESGTELERISNLNMCKHERPIIVIVTHRILSDTALLFHQRGSGSNTADDESFLMMSESSATAATEGQDFCNGWVEGIHPTNFKAVARQEYYQSKNSGACRTHCATMPQRHNATPLCMRVASLCSFVFRGRRENRYRKAGVL